MTIHARDMAPLIEQSGIRDEFLRGLPAPYGARLLEGILKARVRTTHPDRGGHDKDFSEAQALRETLRQDGLTFEQVLAMERVFTPIEQRLASVRSEQIKLATSMNLTRKSLVDLWSGMLAPAETSSALSLQHYYRIVVLSQITLHKRHAMTFISSKGWRGTPEALYKPFVTIEFEREFVIGPMSGISVSELGRTAHYQGRQLLGTLVATHSAQPVTPTRLHPTTELSTGLYRNLFSRSGAYLQKMSLESTAGLKLIPEIKPPLGKDEIGYLLSICTALDGTVYVLNEGAILSVEKLPMCQTRAAPSKSRVMSSFDLVFEATKHELVRCLSDIQPSVAEPHAALQNLMFGEWITQLLHSALLRDAGVRKALRGAIQRTLESSTCYTDFLNLERCFGSRKSASAYLAQPLAIKRGLMHQLQSPVGRNFEQTIQLCDLVRKRMPGILEDAEVREALYDFGAQEVTGLHPKERVPTIITALGWPPQVVDDMLERAFVKLASGEDLLRVVPAALSLIRDRTTFGQRTGVLSAMQRAASYAFTASLASPLPELSVAPSVKQSGVCLENVMLALKPLIVAAADHTPTYGLLVQLTQELPTLFQPHPQILTSCPEIKRAVQKVVEYEEKHGLKQWGTELRAIYGL